MLRIILNVLLFALIFRAVSVLLGHARRALRGRTAPPGRTRPGTTDGKRPYADLSPYDIEDADYEEIRSGHDS